MLKTICICDKCRGEAKKPVGVDFAELETTTGDVSGEWPLLPMRIHLCEACAMELHNLIAGPLEDLDTTETQQEACEDKKKQGNPTGRPATVKVDIGKVLALKAAGWKVKAIAEEMKLTPNQISQILYQEKKKREKENKENGSNN